MSAEIIVVDFKAKRRATTMPAAKPLPKTRPTKRFNKLEVFSAMISTAKTTTVVDARHPDVLLPSFLKTDNSVPIDWSTNFGLIDFEFDERSVRGTLSFNQEPFFVELPWSAVWMIKCEAFGAQEVWKESLPPEILAAYQVKVQETKPSEVQNVRPKRKQMAFQNSRRLGPGDFAEDLARRAGQAIKRFLKR